MQKPLQEGQWVLLGDVTVDIGTLKCLVTLGVNLDVLYEREDITLSYEDLEIVGIHPTEKATGEFAEQSFRADIDRLGGFEKVLAMLIDQGADLVKGAGLLQSAETKIKILHDIAHKLALVLESSLKNDPLWIAYTAHLTKTKQLVQQTELAGLQPPKQRSKARFMNVALYIDWFSKVRQSKLDGNLDHIPEERYNEYFGWMTAFESFHELLHQKVGVVEVIKNAVRRGGYSMAIYDDLMDIFDLMPLDKSVRPFTCEALDAVYEEVAKLNEGERLPGSTEIAESVFGSFKRHSTSGGHGITGNVLTIGALVGKSPTVDEVCKTMKETSVCSVLNWINGHVGETLAKARNWFFRRPEEGQNLTDVDACAAVAG